MGKINGKLDNKAYRAIKAFEKLQKKAVSKESLF
jgi:hypothetical protein